jgi:hypothetical protein
VPQLLKRSEVCRRVRAIGGIVFVTLALSSAGTALASRARAASSQRPPLAVVQDADGLFLDSDGVSEVAFGLQEPNVLGVGAVFVQNVHYFEERIISPASCVGGRPYGLVGGWYLQQGCGAADALVITAFSNTHGASAGTVISIPQPRLGAENVGIVRAGERCTVSRPWTVHFVGGGYKEAPTKLLFNLCTGAYEVAPTQSEATYLDLSAPSPLQPLCAPVTRSPGVEVDGVSGRWVVMVQEPLNSRDDKLLAWRCGSNRAKILAVGPVTSAQLGAGIVTWVLRGAVYAQRLATGRTWRWKARYPFDSAVHTSKMVYGGETCPQICSELHEGNRVLAAPVGAL